MESDRDMETENESWQQLTRKAVEAKAVAAQKARDLEVVVEELRQKLTTVEEERDITAAKAQRVIEDRDTALRHIKQWCDRYFRGEFAAMDAIAGVALVAGGDRKVVPSILDRRRAAEHMQTLSLMTEAADRLAEIERLLEDAGFPNEGGQVQQVQNLLTKYTGGRSV